MTTPALSVCIATRNRTAELVTCLNSLRFLTGIWYEVLVLDDGSDTPIEPRVRAEIAPEIAAVTRFTRHETSTHYIVARNELARMAAAPLILSLDDDAAIIDTRLLEAIKLMAADDTIGAVGFAQVHANGDRFPASAQPAPVEYLCLAPTFYGYGHIVRRELFLRVGGYRERFWAFGEEVEFCKRVWDAGAKVLYLPDIAIQHTPSPSGRSELVRMRYGCRNAIMGALYQEPFPLLLFSIPARFVSYLRWRRIPCQHYKISDRGGAWWQLREFARHAPQVLRDRRPLRWGTMRTWKRLRATWPAYQPPCGEPTP
jgi:GT2 family glycosyltransferase